MSMTRKEFLGGLAAGAALLACGGDDGGSDSSIQRNCAMNGTTATIGSNHSHTITVTASDINAGVNKTYSIQGGADHDHMVTITAAQFATLQSNANGSVMVVSTSVNAHTHDITILCA